MPGLRMFQEASAPCPLLPECGGAERSQAGEIAPRARPLRSLLRRGSRVLGLMVAAAVGVGLSLGLAPSTAWGQGQPSGPEIALDNHAGVEINSGGAVGFDDTPVGGSSTQLFTLRNTGTADLTGILVTKSGATTADFIVVQDPAYTVAAGGSTTFSVRFTPSYTGMRQARLHIASNDADEPYFLLNVSGAGLQSPLRAEQAGQPVLDGGTMFFYTQGRGGNRAENLVLRNTGPTPLTGLALSLDGAAVADYSIYQGLTSTTLAPGASTTLTLRFSAKDLGDRTAALHISCAELAANALDITLLGTAVGPDIDLISATLPAPGPSGRYDFMPLRVGTSVGASFVVSNAGWENLTGLSFAITGDAAGDFRLTSNLGLTDTYPPGVGRAFTIYATPSALGVRTAQLTILSNDPDESPLIVPLKCTGTHPEIQVTTLEGEEIPRGSVVDVGTSRVLNDNPTITKNILIRNTGIGALRISRLSFPPGYVSPTGPPPQAGFWTSLSNDTRWIQEGGYLIVPLKYTAYTPGNHTSILTIGSDDEDEPTYSLQVKGTGLQPVSQVLLPDGSVIVSPPTQQFGSTVVGLEGQSQTYTVRNIGNLPLTVDARIGDGNPPQFVITTPPVNPVPPGGSTTLTVTHRPTRALITTAALEIADVSVEPVQGGGETSVTSTRKAIGLRGTGLPIAASFASADFNALDGDTEALVTVRRTHSHLPMSLEMVTTLSSQSRPWFSAAIAGQDFTPFTNAQPCVVNFAIGELEKTVAVPLISTPSRAGLNREFTVALLTPGAVGYPGGVGIPSQARVHILAGDDVAPELTLVTPTTGKVTQVLPLTVQGTTTDEKGIQRVLVKLNDEPAVEATLSDSGPNQWPVPVGFSADIYPPNGANTLVVTSIDLRGNSTSVSREFTSTGRWPLTYRSGLSGTTGGTVTFSAVPATGALAPSAVQDVNSGERTVGVQAGTTVRLVAKAKPNSIFSHWVKTGGAPETVLEIAGDTVTFVMPAAAITVSAGFEPSPYANVPGETNNWHWLLQPEDPIGSSVARQAYLSGTITPTGSFTGRLMLGGLTHPLSAVLPSRSPAVFTQAGQRRPYFSLPGGGGQLRLERDPATKMLNATLILTSSAGQSGSLTHLTASGWRAIANLSRLASRVELMNRGTRGVFTLRIARPEGFVSPPPVPTALLPEGFGSATITLTNTGTVTLAGFLGDGTAITQSTALTRSSMESPTASAPVYLQMTTPGASTKLGLITGMLGFFPGPDHDVRGDLRWFRPATVNPRPISTYRHGWPQGLVVSTLGALYDSTLPFQQALQLQVPGLPTLGNARLHFTGGGQTGDTAFDNLRIVKNTVSKIPATDPRYTLVITPTTGRFGGLFVPAVPFASNFKPPFNGIILQKGDARGGYGHFLNTSRSEPAPRAGAVTLGPPPAPAS